MSTVDQAQRLLASGQTRDALVLLERAAEQGDAASWLELGLLFLAGRHVDRDLAKARECVSRAAQAGDPTARNIHLQFLALGVGGDANWAEAVDLLRDLAEGDAVAAAQTALFDEMQLSAKGDPRGNSGGRQLSADPEVWAFDGFFSPSECRYLIECARPRLQPSTVVDPQRGQLLPNPVRTSHGMAFPWVSEDLVIQALNRRIAWASGTQAAAGEPLQVLRYEPGQQYRPHFDAYDDTNNQRVFTMLVYLNEDYEGGQTVFTYNGLTFRGHTGEGLLFRNATQSGARDGHAQHAGLPVRSGAKWLASRWIRQRPLVPV